LDFVQILDFVSLFDDLLSYSERKTNAPSWQMAEGRKPVLGVMSAILVSPHMQT
jgi:hypothetical protein